MSVQILDTIELSERFTAYVKRYDNGQFAVELDNNNSDGIYNAEYKFQTESFATGFVKGLEQMSKRLLNEVCNVG